MQVENAAAVLGRTPSLPTVASPDAARPNAAAGDLKGPDWVKDAVFYQVFPDRFRDGDSSNNPEGTAQWGSRPQNDNVFQGGDLQGVEQGVDHIQSLGVNAMYLNPVFTSPSNHRYNITDYQAVDPKLGGQPAFDSMVDRLKAGGVKLILDGVLNHTSNEHPWFQDVMQRGQESPYWNWFNVHRFPVNTWKDDKGVLRSNDYEGWGKPEWGGPYATLPVLKSLDPGVMDALVTGRDSVVRKWLRDGRIDGWRMDAADDVEREVWNKVREVAKQENPETYLLGENWQDASEMLHGDQFDGVTNYKYFQQPAADFFAKKSISADDFVGRLNNGYSKEAKLGMMNILESHDTPRFITVAGGDWYRARPAAIFQMTYQGAPSIYYGAEIGMEGGPDPDSRRAFDWNLANAADARAGAEQLSPKVGGSAEDKATHLTDLYRTLVETRKSSDALRRGDFDVLKTHNDNNTLAYRRSIEGNPDDVIVAINNDVRSHGMSVPTSGFADNGTQYRDALSGQTYTVDNGKLTLPAIDGNYGAILQRVR